MRLVDLVGGIYPYHIDERFASYVIRNVECDSRKVTSGSLFVALKGSRANGADYIEQSIHQGAVCVVHDEDIGSNFLNPNVYFLKVSDCRDFLARVADRFFDQPANEVRCIGVTGTNGKTTVTFLIESILNSVNMKCGVMGTINCHFDGQEFPLTNTTPNILDIMRFLSDMRGRGVKYCAMEVSSHALDQKRVHLLPFRAAIFTNLTQDHLDYHYSMENYFLTKAKLFESLSDQSCAVINGDDPYGRKIITRMKAKTITYGLGSNLDVMATDISLGLTGTRFNVILGQDACEIETSLIGQHNIYNILAAAGACHALGINIEQIKQGIEDLNGVPGRLERVDMGQDFLTFVDYAHTEDALRNVLGILRQLTQGKIFLVFGCGGDRDKTKRSSMGKVASQMADFSIITNDNPRSEEPEDIVHRIVAGFESKNYLIVYDRRKAIERALRMAKKNDIVLIAGKGHESYQIIKGKTFSFDDRETVRELLS